MNAYIYLSIGNQKGPYKDQGPPFAGMSHCQIYKHGNREMVARMRGSKTRTPWTITNEQPDDTGQRRILAGPEPENILFDQVGADQIADYGSQDKSKTPPISLTGKIDKCKNQ
jgi:hypothetical protein